MHFLKQLTFHMNFSNLNLMKIEMLEKNKQTNRIPSIFKGWFLKFFPNSKIVAARLSIFSKIVFLCHRIFNFLKGSFSFFFQFFNFASVTFPSISFFCFHNLFSTSNFPAAQIFFFFFFFFKTTPNQEP